MLWNISIINANPYNGLYGRNVGEKGGGGKVDKGKFPSAFLKMAKRAAPPAANATIVPTNTRNPKPQAHPVQHRAC